MPRPPLWIRFGLDFLALTCLPGVSSAQFMPPSQAALVRTLLNSVNSMLDESIKPAVSSIKDAADQVRGTTEFVGRTTVSPIARAYGAVAGVKKGVGVLSGLNKMRR